MCKIILITLLMLSSFLNKTAWCQLPQLSIRNIVKLNKFTSGEQRLRAYYRMYKRDSIRRDRNLKRALKRSIDSTMMAQTEKRRLKMLDDSFVKVLDSGQRVNANDLIATPDSLQLDSLKKRLLLLNQSFKKYRKQRHDKLPDQWLPSTKYKLPKSVAIHSDAIADLTTGTKTNSPITHDSVSGVSFDRPPLASPIDSLRTLALEKKLSMVPRMGKYVSRFGDEVGHAKKEVSKLFSKYRKFGDSTDPSSCMKRSSLKGRSFGEHLHIASNFSSITLPLISIGFSPEIGYKFNSRFWVGAGYNFKILFADSLNADRITFRNSGYRFFASLLFYKSYFTLAEWERTQSRMIGAEVRSPAKNDFRVGIGTRLLIHPRAYMTIMALYNPLVYKMDVFHQDRFAIRIGMQLSELAIRGTKKVYDPNR